MANVPRYEELPNYGGGFAYRGPSNAAFEAQSTSNNAWLGTANLAARTATDIINVGVQLNELKNENLYNQTLLDYRHATDNQALTLKQRQGIDAQGNTEEFKAYTDKLRDEYSNRIADNRWRAQFIDQTRQMDHSLGMNLAGDESNKTFKAQQDLLASRVQLAQEEVAMFLDDPQRLPGAVDALRNANANLYRNTGADDEVINQQGEILVSNTLASKAVSAVKLGDLNGGRRILDSGWLMENDADTLRLAIQSKQKQLEAENRQRLMVSTALMRENLQMGIFNLQQGDDELLNNTIDEIEGSLAAEGFKITKGNQLIALPPENLDAIQYALDLAANAPGTPDEVARTTPNLMADFLSGQAPQIQLDLSSVRGGDLFKTSWGRSQYDLLKQGYIARDSQNLFSYWQEMPLENARASITQYQNSLSTSDPDYKYKYAIVDQARNMYDNMVASVSQDPAAYLAQTYNMGGLDTISISNINDAAVRSRQETIKSAFPWLPKQPVLSSAERQGFRNSLISAPPEDRMNLLYNLSERLGPEYRAQAFREIGVPTQILDSVMAMGYDTIYNQEAQKLLDIWALSDDDVAAIKRQVGTTPTDARNDLSKNSYEYQYWQQLLNSNYNIPGLKDEAIQNLDFIERQYYVAQGDVSAITAREGSYDYYDNGASVAKLPTGKYQSSQISYGLYNAKNDLRSEMIERARLYAENTGQNADVYETTWGQHFDDNVVAMRIPGHTGLFAWFDRANGQAILNNDGSLKTLDLDQLYQNVAEDYRSYLRVTTGSQANVGLYNTSYLLQPRND